MATGRALSLAMDNWRWLYGGRVFLSAALPLITALPLLRNIRGKGTWRSGIIDQHSPAEKMVSQALGGFSTDLYAYEEIDFVIRLKRYARQRDQKFAVIHQHPVVTSGRKADPTFSSIGVLFISNLLAVLLFGLHYLLPKGWLNKPWISKLLGYWYKGH